MKNLTVLKIGGSILTYKEKDNPKLRTRVIKSIISQVRLFLENPHNRLIIVAGTGSFGHHISQKVRQDSNTISHKELSAVNKSVAKAGIYLWDSLESFNIPAIVIQSSDVISNHNGKISSFQLENLKSFLNSGLVIVLLGNEVIDESLGFSICSSDQIASYLASNLNAQQLLYASDVDGIYTDNPKINHQAKLISQVSTANLAQIKSYLKTHNPHDVTSEMLGKIDAIFNSGLPKDINTRIFNGLKKDSIIHALTGQKLGTEIEL